MSTDKHVLEKQAVIAELHLASLTGLVQLNKAGRRTFDSLGLTYGQAMLLILLERGESRFNELGQLLVVLRPALSALITHLAQVGLVERQGHEDDGRRVVIKLTAKGSEACRDIKQAWHENFPIDLQRLSNEELRRLVEAVQIFDKYGLG